MSPLDTAGIKGEKKYLVYVENTSYQSHKIIDYSNQYIVDEQPLPTKKICGKNRSGVVMNNSEPRGA